jgi:Ca2+-binding EF-hand superfamily protein
MSKLGVFLARQELTTVYNHFDFNKDGTISYEEFIGTLRVCIEFSHFETARYQREEIGSCKTSMGFPRQARLEESSVRSARQPVSVSEPPKSAH